MVRTLRVGEQAYRFGRCRLVGRAFHVRVPSWSWRQSLQWSASSSPREYGRSEETDGLLAAYGVFIAITIAAQAIRVAVLAAARARLGRGPPRGRAGRRRARARALRVSTRAVRGARCASARRRPDGIRGRCGNRGRGAALDRPGGDRAVVRRSGGERARRTQRLRRGSAGVRRRERGCADVDPPARRRRRRDRNRWGMALNGAIALSCECRARRAFTPPRTPSRALRPQSAAIGIRLRKFATGAALPLGLQLLVCRLAPVRRRARRGRRDELRVRVSRRSLARDHHRGFAGARDVGASLARGSRCGRVRAPRHRDFVARAHACRSRGWCFAIAGGDLVETVLGGAYGGEIGAEVGRLVVLLAPWMAFSVGIGVAFPLAFVAARTAPLPWIALAALAVQIQLAWLGSSLFELDGLAVALTISTAVVLCGLLAALHALRETLPGSRSPQP